MNPFTQAVIAFLACYGILITVVLLEGVFKR